MEAQRQLWDALRERIAALVGQLTEANVQESSVQLFQCNLARGRGLVVREILGKVLADGNSSAVCALLVCILNSKLPDVGEIIAARAVILFKKMYVENNPKLSAIMAFICALALQRVVEDVLMLQMLQVFLEDPTPSSIKMALDLLKEGGGLLDSASKAAANIVYDRLRTLLQKGLDQRSEAVVKEVLHVRRQGHKRLTLLPKHLDLIEDDDKETHFVDLTQQQNPRSELNFFFPIDNFEAQEREYMQWAAEMLPEEAETKVETKVTDMTDSVLLQHQKNIYLTIMSAMSADEAVHKLLRLQLSAGLDADVMADMIVKCCAQEKTYSKYFGVIGEKLCRVRWRDVFAKQFDDKYGTIFQYEGPQLRNMGRFFGHLIAADALLPQETLGRIELLEGKTTSAGRVFIKFIFSELVEEMGIGELQKMVEDDSVRPSLWGLFPAFDVLETDTEHIIFAINYFTAIGLGVLTEEMRSVLERMERGRERDRGRLRSRSRLRLFSRSP